ncbi:MAG: molybdopterin-synthase adenylyltransferase MoeB [Hyphomonadaceae bacterium]|nr:molybdopterin-synthase adenylyltransferase MoeB [Hyphomonadaceae bacterium]
MSFSPEERERYARHILLKEIGGPGQQQLKAATVAIVGMGGLGAPAALYLAAAGVGRLRLIDDDAVALSNLQRQVLYETRDIGEAKVARAADRLTALNPAVTIEVVRDRLTASNARGLFSSVDLVLDGTDDFITRFAVNAACHAAGLPLISGAVGRWEGQVATFKSGLTKGQPIRDRFPCYRCLVPEAPQDIETCAQVGVVGALTGVVGSMMALEAVKEIAAAGESLAGKVVIMDALTSTSRTILLKADPACATCGHD